MNILFHFLDRPINRLDRATVKLDFRLFSGGYINVHVYSDKPASIDVLEDNIEALIHEISAEMLERVCQNWTKRMDHLRRSRD